MLFQKSRDNIQIDENTHHNIVGGPNMNIVNSTEEIHNAYFHIPESNAFKVVEDLLIIQRY